MGISHTQHEAAPVVAQPVSRATFDAIRQFDTCTISLEQLLKAVQTKR
jgi:hypothetical protein